MKRLKFGCKFPSKWLSFQSQSTRPRNVVFGGGLPIREAGALIGGIGVSGGSAEQDEICARAGLAALGLEAA